MLRIMLIVLSAIGAWVLIPVYNQQLRIQNALIRCKENYFVYFYFFF